MSYFTDYAEPGCAEGPRFARDRHPGRTSTRTSPPAASSTARCYGIGQSSISYAMYVNAAAIKAPGGSVPPQGWTWDQFAEFARRLRRRSGATARYGTDRRRRQLPVLRGLRPSARHGTCFPTDGETPAAKETVRGMVPVLGRPAQREGGAAAERQRSRRRRSRTRRCATGESPLQFGWVQQVTFYQPLVQGARWPCSRSPQGKAGDLTGQFVKASRPGCVSADDQARRGAARLIDFLLNDDRAIQAIGILLGVPPSKKARDLAPRRRRSPAAGAGDHVRRGPWPARSARRRQPWPKGYGELLTGFGRIAENIGFGKTNPAAGAQEFVDLAGKISRRHG